MAKLKLHPIAARFALSKPTIKLLAHRMAQVGFDPEFPIALFEGKILDGRHRYEAALKAGVEPRTIIKSFKDRAEALAWVGAQNLVRRQASPRQQIFALALDPEQFTAGQIMGFTGSSISTVRENMKRARDMDRFEAEGVAQGKVRLVDTKQRPRFSVAKGRGDRIEALCRLHNVSFRRMLTRVMDAGLDALS